MTKEEMSRSDRWAVGLAGFVTRRPWLVIAGALLVAAVATTGAQHLEFANNYDTPWNSTNLLSRTVIN